MRTVLLAIAAIVVLIATSNAATKVTIDENHVIEINGKKTFTIGLTLPPAPDAKAPNGKHAMEEFRSAGVVFMRTGPMQDPTGEWVGQWDERWIAIEKQYHDAAARAGMYCMPWLKELSHVNDDDKQKEQRLREVVRMFKDHPGLGIWKGEDEPQWGEMNKTGSKPPPPLINAFRIIKEEDPNHPVWIVQAPRGTIEQLKPYNPSYDIGGVDIYPISYPPGRHVPADDNKEISAVGDYTRKMIEVVEGQKPIWLTLQIAWSGVARPGQNTLRFPTFHEQRFMSYQAIINGARGLIFFGGSLQQTLNEHDKPYGWNWTFWNRVLRPVLEEIGDKSPLAPALTMPESKLPIKADGEGIELAVREVGNTIYILAASRNRDATQEITFTGLPDGAGEGDVMYESPRKVQTDAGSFKDWFAPYDVHVYKFNR